MGIFFHLICIGKQYNKRKMLGNEGQKFRQNLVPNLYGNWERKKYNEKKRGGGGYHLSGNIYPCYQIYYPYLDQRAELPVAGDQDSQLNVLRVLGEVLANTLHSGKGLTVINVYSYKRRYIYIYIIYLYTNRIKMDL